MVTLNNSTITTTGNQARGVFALDSSTVTLDNSSIDTSGENANGVYARNNSVVDILNGSAITTTGDFARGVRAEDSVMVTLENSSVSSLLSDEVLAQTFAGSDTLFVQIIDNTLQSGAGTIVLDNSAGGTLTVQKFSNLAELALSNGIPDANITESGMINYVVP
jgi:hypothetical protein